MPLFKKNIIWPIFVPFFKQVNDIWCISFKSIDKFIKNNNYSDEDDIIAKVEKHILYNFVNNKKLMRNLIIKSYDVLDSCYEFLFQVVEDGSLISYLVGPKEVINYIDATDKSKVKKWQWMVYDNLKQNLDKAERFFKKEIADNITYNDLIEILKSSEDEMLRMIKDNSFRGLTGEELYSLIFQRIYNGFSVNKSLLYLFNIDAADEEKIYNNIKAIEYYYEPNEIGNMEFVESRNIVDEFSLNEKLKDFILDGMPTNFNKLQKAYYIYRRLCQKFSYDEDFFCYKYALKEAKDAKKNMIDHTDIKRLNDIDVDSDVICSEITMIFAKFLDILEIPYQIVDYNMNTNIDYKDSHMMVIFKIDDIVMKADAADGLTRSDLSIEKSYDSVRNFKPIESVPLRLKKAVHKQLTLVDEYLNRRKDRNQFYDALDLYESMYKKEKTISIKDRVKIIMDVIKNTDLKFIDILNMINYIKKNVFYSCGDACKIEFIVNRVPLQIDKTYELSILIIYNENGDVNEFPSTNKYIVITSDKNKENLDFDEIKYRFENNIYGFTSSERKKIYEGWGDGNDTKRQGSNGFKRKVG